MGHGLKHKINESQEWKNVSESFYSFIEQEIIEMKTAFPFYNTQTWN